MRNEALLTIGVFGFAVLGGAIGLSVAELLAWLSHLTDRKAGIVFLASIMVFALVVASDGFVFARNILQGRKSKENMLRRFALLSTVAFGGLLVRSAGALFLPEHDRIAAAAVVVIGIGFLVSLAVYSFIGRSRSVAGLTDEEMSLPRISAHPLASK